MICVAHLTRNSVHLTILTFFFCYCNFNLNVMIKNDYALFSYVALFFGIDEHKRDWVKSGTS